MDAAKTHLLAAFGGFSEFGQGIDPDVWNDKYLLGYAQGSIAIMSSVFGANLTTEQRGRIMVDAIRELVGTDWREVMDRMLSQVSQGGPTFRIGADHGSNVAILMTDRAGPELLADPDVQLALTDAPKLQQQATALFGSSYTGQTGSAGAALMHLYMERYRAASGH